MAVGVKVVNRPGSFAQQVFLPAIAKGSASRSGTSRRTSSATRGLRSKTDIETIQYPEEKKTTPSGSAACTA